MPKWLYTLDLSDVFHADDVPLPTKARTIADRIEKSRFFDKAWTSALSDVADQLRDLAEDERDDVEEFDLIMNDLYDYADAERVWVDTFLKPARVPALATEEEV